MRNMIILAAVVIMAGAPVAKAEDNDALLQASYQGAVTGDAEKDTVAYDMHQPSDLWVRFSPECFATTAAGDLARNAKTTAEIHQAAK